MLPSKVREKDGFGGKVTPFNASAQQWFPLKVGQRQCKNLGLRVGDILATPSLDHHLQLCS